LFADGFERLWPASDDEQARAETGEVQSHGTSEAGAPASEENIF
jgi:hypothetical protein